MQDFDSCANKRVGSNPTTAAFGVFVGSNPTTPVMENRNFQKSDMKLKDVWSYQYKAVKLACGGKLRIER